MNLQISLLTYKNNNINTSVQLRKASEVKKWTSEQTT